MGSYYPYEAPFSCAFCDLIDMHRSFSGCVRYSYFSIYCFVCIADPWRYAFRGRTRCNLLFKTGFPKTWKPTGKYKNSFVRYFKAFLSDLTCSDFPDNVISDVCICK